MLIGLISDTHGRLHESAYAALADCDAIIHAGDIGGPSILRELETLAPVYAVLGNNDYSEYGSTVRRYAKPVIDGVRFLVAHYPNDVRIGKIRNSALAPGEPVPHVCVHGHTHLPRLDFGSAASPAQFVINPGSASRPRGGYARSVGKMEVEAGRILSIRIEMLSGTPLLEWPVV